MYRLLLFSTSLILLSILLSCYSQNHDEDDDDEVTLNQIFGIKEDYRRSAPPTRQPKRNPNIINIGSLTREEMELELKNLESLYNITDEDDDYIMDKTREMFHVPKKNISMLNITKNIDNNTRRFWLTYKPGQRLYWWHWTHDWYWAQMHMNVAKVTDNCLTTIYMARNKIKEMEKHPLYNTKSPAFRIAFIYVRIRNIRRKIQRIYSRINNAYIYIYWRDQNNYRYWWWNSKLSDSFYRNYKYFDPNVFLSKYAHALALHVEYTYWWRVLVRLHERTCNVSHIYMTRPTDKPSTTATNP